MKWPNGEVSTKKCDCDTPDYWYEPQETHITMLKYKIRNSNYPSERRYSLERSYNPSKSSYYNDYSYSDFGVQFIYDEFCDDVIEKRKELGYGKRIGFKTKEECQKYCDWLNKNK